MAENQSFRLESKSVIKSLCGYIEREIEKGEEEKERETSAKKESHTRTHTHTHTLKYSHLPL